MPSPIELRNKRVLVVGLARTGVATSLFCAARGAHVTATDTRIEEELGDSIAPLRAAGLRLELGGHREETLMDQDLIVPSPGVPADEALRAAEGVYVAGDIALHHHPLFRRAIRVEHWEVAKGQGRGIATSIAAGTSTPYAKVPYFWSDQYEVSLEYRGNASGDDHAVWRGDRDGLRFSVFYLRDGVVDAVLSMNDKEGGEAGAKIIESRQRVDAKALSDSKVDLAELVPAGKPG